MEVQQVFSSNSSLPNIIQQNNNVYIDFLDNIIVISRQLLLNHYNAFIRLFLFTINNRRRSGITLIILSLFLSICLTVYINGQSDHHSLSQ